MSENKQKIINDVYFDKAGFQSRANTLKDAKKRDATITMKDVEEFFKKNVEQKKQLRGYNSFVSPHPFYEFQVDLFFINDLEKQKFKVGMVILDVFSRYAVVIPIKSKSEGDVASGLIEGLNKFDKSPQLIFSDDEKALSTEAMQKYLKEKNIHHHITRGHANHSERFIRTYKDMLYKRVEADEKKNKKDIQWTDYNFEILLTYNNKMVHSSTGHTPKEALKEKNYLKAKVKMSMDAVKTRKYPEINVGDKVKIYRKKAITEKERTSNWSKEAYEVEKIQKKLGQNYFYLKNDSRGYLRNELLKI